MSCSSHQHELPYCLQVYLIEFTAQKTFTTLWEKGGEDVSVLTRG